MFLAMALALPLHFLWQWVSPRLCGTKKQKGGIADSGYQSDCVAETEHIAVPMRTYFILMIPAMFDLVGTALAKVGLMYCTVSVYQLVRCTVMIVTALLKTFVLGHRLTSYNWAGVALNTLAMVMVSATSFVGEVDEGERDPRLGILFLVLSCMVQGTQYVFEERMMEAEGAPPLVVVGMEGIWGALIMGIVVWPWAMIIPGSDAGVLENVQDSWHMLCNSSAIRWTLAGFWVTVFLYNVFAVFVTYLLSSLWHAILDNFRPVSVWGTDLFLWYVVFSHTHQFGEEWTQYSWLQFAGMLTLFFGTAVYNATIRLPCLAYPVGGDTSAAAGEDYTRLDKGGIGADPSLASFVVFNAARIAYDSP